MRRAPALLVALLGLSALCVPACGSASSGSTPAPDLFVHASAVVNTDDLRLSYDLWPSRTPAAPRTPVVLIGGFPTDVKEDWADVARALSTDRDVLTYDPRGVGETGIGPTPGSYTQNQMDVDLEELIQQVFPTAKPCLVGCSVRGRIALQRAFDSFNDSSLVLAGAAGSTPTLGPDHAAFVDVFGNASWGTNPDLSTRLDLAKIVLDAPADRVALVAALGQGNRPGGGAMRWSGFLTGATPGIQFISLPTLVLAGSADRVYAPDTGQALATEIGGSASFYEVPGGAHAFWFDDPLGFAAEIRAFVDSL